MTNQHKGCCLLATRPDCRFLHLMSPQRRHPLSLHGHGYAQPAFQVAFAMEAAAAAAVAATRAPPAALTEHALATPHANPAVLPPRDFLLLQPGGRLVPATLSGCSARLIRDRSGGHDGPCDNLAVCDDTSCRVLIHVQLEPPSPSFAPPADALGLPCVCCRAAVLSHFCVLGASPHSVPMCLLCWPGAACGRGAAVRTMYFGRHTTCDNIT